ncbi:MAG TPA: hypothetical protein VD930_13645 [Gemmatimonadales bacterium]|nr:hypothetical protein [Gemmatimonadales bacterium]
MRLERGLVLLVAIPLLAGCGGDGAQYAGTWKRDLYGEGEIQMKLAANGGVELMLPSPRWPDSVDMKGQASFKGDTMVFKADTAARACQTQDARYVIRMADDQLRIAGLGADKCGNRRAALVGTWHKSG